MSRTASGSGLPDRDLVYLAQKGDQRAFGFLVGRHQGLVRGLLRRMGAQPAMADDIAQEAFMAAYTGLAGYRAEGGFGAWVCRIAARIYGRRARYEYRYDLRETFDDEPIEAPEPGLVMDLDAALATLKPAERLCVSLCSGAGYSHPEAAELLNLPLGTVKSHVKRGLDKLRIRLAPQNAERSTNG